MKTGTVGFRFAFMALLVALILLCTTGCFQRTIYVPDGTAVRLRAPIKKAKVWVILLERVPKVYGGHATVVIGRNGRVIRYTPGL